MPLLEVQRVTRRFGGIVALDGVSLDVGEGEIVGLIGPNGAGKTTVFNLVTRLYRPDAGDIRFEGESLLRAAPHDVPRLGIARPRARGARLRRPRPARGAVGGGLPVRDAEAHRARARARVAPEAAPA